MVNGYRDTSHILRHGLTAEQITLYYLSRSKCDICNDVFPWDGRMHNFAIDHDHKHCPTDQGCPKCVRGFLCRACNMLEGAIIKAIRRGVITSVDGRLAEYWAHPPFQRWLRRGPSTFGKQQVSPATPL